MTRRPTPPAAAPSKAEKAAPVTADDVQLVTEEHLNVLGLVRMLLRATRRLDTEEDEERSDLESALEIVVARMDWIFDKLNGLEERLKAQDISG